MYKYIWAETQCISLQKKAIFEFQIHLIQSPNDLEVLLFFLNFVLVEFVLTAFKEFEISSYFGQNLKNKTRVPCYKKRKSIFIMFVSLQYSLQILSSDKNFVCRTFQATNYDELIRNNLVLFYY
jgi:23S rRNA U2552 (ribose-2'-O)-methylase RlmE/FtsJ